MTEDRVKNLRKETHFLYRGKSYVSIGHAGWLGFLVSIGTFILVLSGYGMQYIPWFAAMFNNRAEIFLVVALPIYLTLCGFVGYWALYKGAEGTRSELDWHANPAYWKIINTIIERVDGLETKIDRILELLEDVKKDKMAT